MTAEAGEERTTNFPLAWQSLATITSHADTLEAGKFIFCPCTLDTEVPSTVQRFTVPSAVFTGYHELNSERTDQAAWLELTELPRKDGIGPARDMSYIHGKLKGRVDSNDDPSRPLTRMLTC